MLKRFFKHRFPMWMWMVLNGSKLPPNSLPLKQGQKGPMSPGHPCGILNAVSICSSEWSEQSLSVTRRLKVQHSRMQPWNGKIKSDNHNRQDDSSMFNVDFVTFSSADKTWTFSQMSFTKWCYWNDINQNKVYFLVASTKSCANAS